MSADPQSKKGRDYSSISPSAKFVLLLKGVTDIPYARETAELISLPEKFQPDFNKRDLAYWARAMHFDIRYKSIDQLLSGLPIKNILELSSGFSFRGLVAAREKDVHYIDTDLPAMIAAKKGVMASLPSNNEAFKGKLEILPLNALDETQFNEVIAHFLPGEVVIANEGLLMYLDTAEKKKLCNIIRAILQKRGGYWITADIYIKTKDELPPMVAGDGLSDFLEKQHVRENMFESFDEVGAFFKSEGFVLDKEAEPGYSKSTVLKYVRESATQEQLDHFSKSGKIHATWRLKLVE